MAKVLNLRLKENIYIKTSS